MAQGNWDGEVVKAKPRCRFCRRVVLVSEMVRVDGVYPAHKVCADDRNRPYTVGPKVTPMKTPK